MCDIYVIIYKYIEIKFLYIYIYIHKIIAHHLLTNIQQIPNQQMSFPVNFPQLCSLSNDITQYGIIPQLFQASCPGSICLAPSAIRTTWKLKHPWFCTASLRITKTLVGYQHCFSPRPKHHTRHYEEKSTVSAEIRTVIFIQRWKK